MGGVVHIEAIVGIAAKIIVSWWLQGKWQECARLTQLHAQYISSVDYRARHQNNELLHHRKCSKYLQFHSLYREHHQCGPSRPKRKIWKKCTHWAPHHQDHDQHLTWKVLWWRCTMCTGHHSITPLTLRWPSRSSLMKVHITPQSSEGCSLSLGGASSRVGLITYYFYK